MTIYKSAKNNDVKLSHHIKSTAFGLMYDPRTTDGDTILVVGEHTSIAITVLYAFCSFCQKKRIILIDRDISIEKADEYFSPSKRTFVINVYHGENSGLYAAGGTMFSGAASMQITYNSISDATAGKKVIENLCNKLSSNNFQANVVGINSAAVVNYEFFDSTDCELFTIKLANTLNGNELIEIQYAYEAPYQDEYMLSLTHAKLRDIEPQFMRLNYYPLTTCRTVITKFILGENEDFSSIADFICSMLTEE